MTTTVFLILLICLLTMRFFTTCMIILLIGVFVMADQQAHAEAAGPGDVRITDRTHYNNCTDSTLTKIVPARPPYYTMFICTDPHNTKVLSRCSAGGLNSFCTMDDCEKAKLKFGQPWSKGADHGVACAIVDEYGGTEIIRPTAQETAAVPPTAANANSAQCDPAFVTMNAILVHATIACNKDYMDTKIGIDTMVLAHQCDAVLGKQKIHSIIRTAMQEFDSEVKDSGKKEACARVDNAFSEIGEAVKN